jgi:hypothetical protein
LLKACPSQTGSQFWRARIMEWYIQCDDTIEFQDSPEGFWTP